MQKGDFGAEGRGRRWRCSLGRMGDRGAKALALFAWEDGARGGEGAGAVPLGNCMFSF